QKQLFDLSKKLLPAPPTPAILEDLRRVVAYHEWRYYALNDPVISDAEYDNLYKKIEQIEAAHPELITPDSPTQRVSSDLTEDFPPVKHLVPMLSLDNSYNLDDLKDFDERIKNYLGMDKNRDIEYVVEPKFDGGSISLLYENDRFVQAASRGNGFVGDDITPNIRTLRSVPLQVPFSKKNIVKAELRGEALIRKDVFEKLNKEREADGQPPFANPRNAATGGLRTKDPAETAARKIEVFLYRLGYAVDARGNDRIFPLKTHDATIQLLQDLGFKVPLSTPRDHLLPERKVCNNIEEATDFCIKWQDQREQYPYEVDGMVIKVNDLQLQRRVGATAHHPRWAIAFKFKAKQATTKLLRVEFQVGKLGTITPVAKLQPVELAGATISSVSLHNEDFIRNKDIRIGDTVLVERAGDVIPYIVKPMEELRDGSEREIFFPKYCPVCHAPLVRDEGEAAWTCENPECEAQIVARMIHHVSKNAMNIEGMGESIVERFYNLGWLHTIADIYRLDYDKIAQLEGFGKKSADNLKASIEKAKHNPIYRLLFSLSIHHLGIKASKTLAAEIHHVLDLRNWDEERFIRIKDIGPALAHSVMRFFHNEKNISILKDMESLGVNMLQKEEDRPRSIDQDAPLYGKTILFTGSLQHMGRKEAQALAGEAGAKNISAVSRNLNILVVGEKPGSKLKKARALGSVEIWTEEEFLRRVGRE
ncbi:MAG TPA: NAD-dependent DNA ligase LigA, partial [Bacteroidetes bacterium]|nr:NAD-dependent DNA ligase LigA [Bacteroidota bacterium]